MYFQRYYNYREAGRGSYSFQMIPDIVLERKSDDGTQVDEQRRKVIKAAYILVPKEPNTADLEARYCNRAYQELHGFGIVVLTPAWCR
ncbi:MAG: hypothetical protein NUK65_01670 [Firmicutes bacterium]|nr:hypothetical protein [Bacillota bacterium]